MTLAGLRVDSSYKPPDMGSDGVISVLQDREATLRLFGAGLTDGLSVKFTGEKLERGASCEQSQTTVAFEVRPADRDGTGAGRDGKGRDNAPATGSGSDRSYHIRRRVAVPRPQLGRGPGAVCVLRNQ